jgi:hypothetical protein
MQGGSRARAGRTLTAVTLATLVVTLLPGAARAVDAAGVPELSLTWQAPVGCASAPDVEGQFARLLGGPARTPSGKHVEASAIVRSPAQGRWILDLATVLDGAVGRRSLQSDSCASVTAAAALILALMIDPAAAERADAAAQRLADAVIPPPPSSPPPVSVTPPPVEPPLRTLSPYARAFAGAVVSLLPSPAPAAGIAVGAGRGRFGAELSFVATNKRRENVSGIATEGGDFQLLVGGARACGVVVARVVVGQVCLGAEVERLAGSGLGVATTYDKTVEMLAGTGGLLVALPLGARVALTLDLDAAARPYHPAFDLVMGTRIFRVPVVSGFAALGIMLTI